MFIPLSVEVPKPPVHTRRLSWAARTVLALNVSLAAVNATPTIWASFTYLPLSIRESYNDYLNRVSKTTQIKGLTTPLLILLVISSRLHREWCNIQEAPEVSYNMVYVKLNNEKIFVRSDKDRESCRDHQSLTSETLLWVGNPKGQRSRCRIQAGTFVWILDTITHTIRLKIGLTSYNIVGLKQLFCSNLLFGLQVSFNCQTFPI